MWTGATTNGHHAWNLVELDGEWQWVDSTWNTFNRYYGNNTWVDGDKRLDYFLCPTMFISTDHGAKGFRTINGINANLTNQSYAETQKLIQEEEEKIKETMKQEQDELQKAAKNIAAAASAWAQSEISTAILEELALSDLCENFTANITREEFCRLMVRLVEKCSGQDIDAYLKAKGLSVNNKFTDTSSAEAAAANALGIVYGKSETQFAPSNSITRQEAATMLARTAKLLGLQAGTPVQFADRSTFASWATESINFVSGLVDSTSGYQVMGGVGNNTFLPNGTYSREQAIATALRLYRCTN